jgi:hypothetical protein
MGRQESQLQRSAQNRAQAKADRSRASCVHLGSQQNQGGGMDEVVREIEMRIAGAGKPGFIDDVTGVIQALDPGAKVRLDPATGIVHALSRRETLEVTDALTRAGYECTGMTGG